MTPRGSAVIGVLTTQVLGTASARLLRVRAAAEGSAVGGGLPPPRSFHSDGKHEGREGGGAGA